MAGLLETMGSGGPVIAVLAVLSVLSLALIAAKTAQLWGVRAGEARRDDALARWAAGDRAAARAALEAGATPADRLTAYAMEGTEGGVPRAPLEAEILRRGNREVDALARHIRLLELIAMIAPLLGLLGTVLGMIESFQQLELAQGSANASVLAGGIWQALLTTAAGLVVAIPAAIGATLLSARVEGAALSIEAAVGRFFLLEDSAGARPGAAA